MCDWGPPSPSLRIEISVPILILSNQDVLPSFQWFPRWITGTAGGVKGSRDGNEFEKNHFKDNVAKFCA